MKREKCGVLFKSSGGRQYVCVRPVHNGHTHVFVLTHRVPLR